MTAKTPKLRFVQFANAGGKPLAKKISYDFIAGQLSTELAAQMVQGKGLNTTVPGIEGFAEFLKQRVGKTSCAVAYGLLATDDQVSIASQDLIAAGKAVKGAMARTNAALQYAKGEPGILPVDFDIKGRVDYTELDEILCGVMPELEIVRRIYTPSSSSQLYNDDKLVSVKSGWRLHLPVDDASRIASIGSELFARLIDANNGWNEISKSGQRLLRTVIDAAMYQPSRLDFVHGAVFDGGLEWRHSVHMLGEAELLATSEIECRDFDEWKRLSFIVAKLRADALPEAIRVNAAWRAERVEEAVARGVPREKAERIYAKAVSDLEGESGDGFIGELEGDFRLYRKDGASFTIDDALAEPDTYHGMTVLDPCENDYPSGECAKLFIKNQHSFPVLYSMAHGEMSYRLTMSDEQRGLIVLNSAANRIQSSGPLSQCFVEMSDGDKVRLNKLADGLSSRGEGLIWDLSEKTLNDFIWEALESSKAKGKEWTGDDVEFVLTKTKVFHGKIDIVAFAVMDVAAKFERRELQRQENRAIGQNISGDIRTSPEPLTLDDAEDSLVYIISGKRVADRRDKSVFKLEERTAQFNASYTTVCNKKGAEETFPTTQLWFGSEQRKTVAAVTWRPDAPEFEHAPEGAVSGGRTDAFNTWRGLPSYAPPADWGHHVTIWDEHLDYLIPDRQMLRRFSQWLAHIVQKPGELPATAFCMIAETHGIGRNWMASVLTRVLRGYVRASLSLHQLFEKSFNGTISQKLLAIVDEVHERQTRDRYTVANRLRQMITAEHNELNAKYGGNWVEHNCIRWLFFSNYLDALPVGDNDRRVEFIENPTQCQSEAYYTRLFEALKDPQFIAAVRHRLQTADLSGFNPGQHAARTEFRAAAIDASQGALEAAIREYLNTWPGTFTTLTHLCTHLQNEIGNRDFEPHFVAQIARQFGLYGTKIRIRPYGTLSKQETVMFVGSKITANQMTALLPTVILQRFKEWARAFDCAVKGWGDADVEYLLS